jgi:hypothetical protein
MSRGQRQTVRKPAMKLPHLRKKIARAKVAGGVVRRAKRGK